MTKQKPINLNKPLPRLPNARALSAAESLATAARQMAPNPKRTNTWQNKVARAIGTVGGAAAGFYLGGPAGAFSGGSSGYSFGDTVARFLGYGKYKIKYNSRMKVPAMHQTTEKILVRHREFVSDISSSTDFVATTFAINPSNTLLFPWLSQLSNQYQEWCPKGIVMEYVSTSADALNSTNTALGTVMMATQYRSTARAFASKFELLNEHFANDAKPSESFCHPVECDPAQRPLKNMYIDSSSISGDDPKTFNLGTFTIATAGSQAAAVVGELWVTYEIELNLPNILGTIGGNTRTDHYFLSSYGNSTPLGGTTYVVPKATGVGTQITSGTVLDFSKVKAGRYLLLGSWKGVSTASCTLSTTYGSAFAGVDILENTSNYNEFTNGTVAQYTWFAIVDFVPSYTTANNQITLSAATLPGTPASADIIITEVPGQVI